MVEQPVRKLELIQIKHHLMRRADNILAVGRDAICLRLEHVDHVHIVYP